MKKIKRALIAILSLLLIFCMGFSTYAEEDINYYVVFLNDNYQIKNQNKLTLVEDDYILENINLTSHNSFYVVSSEGQRWYGKDNKEMSVKEAGAYNYNIYFSVNSVYNDSSSNIYESNSHISYSFYTPKSYTLNVNTDTYELTYNNYQTSYDAYYISDIYLAKDDILSVNSGEDIFYYSDDLAYQVKESGYYRFVFTKAKISNGNTYMFNDQGIYGTGDEFKYQYYLADSEKYYLAFNEGFSLIRDDAITVNDLKLYPLYKDESIISAPTYKTKDLYNNTKDNKFKYQIYQYNYVLDSYYLIDDDNDDDSVISSIKVSDIGWYNFTLAKADNKYASSFAYSERSLDDYYFASNINNYLFDGNGEVDLDDYYKFNLIDIENEDLYHSDYDEYVLYLNITEANLKNGNITFYITNGNDKYKNNTEDIIINTKGYYQIIFSNEHTYGKNHHYKFSLVKDTTEKTEVYINNVNDYLAFVEKINFDASSSMNMDVYLTTDLYFSTVEIVPIKVFNGHFYGNYHKMCNISLTIDEDKSYVGVFELLTKYGEISNVSFDNININASEASYVGVIAKSYGNIKNVNVSGNIKGKKYVGGIVGYNGNYKITDDDSLSNSNDTYSFSYITNCINNADIFGEANVGGISGFNGGKIISCCNNAFINDYKFSSTKNILNIGGICGYSTGEIIDTINNGDVGYSSIGTFIGGISGFLTGTIYYSINNGEVLGYSYAGGLVGYYGTLTNEEEDKNSIDSILSNYFNNEETDAPEVDLGKHNIIYSINNANVTASSYTGGIVGYNNASLTINSCASGGNISSLNGSYAGGIVGYMNSGEVISSASSGIIKGEGTSLGNYVGGIVGYSNALIHYSMSSATLSGLDYIGGIAGYSTSTGSIISCYTNTLILDKTTTNYKGAIAGYADSLNESAGTFNDLIKYNYYLSLSIGGINNVNYGSDSLFAAARLESNELISNPSFSVFLANEFSNDYYAPGNTIHSYPYLRNFDEAIEAKDFESSLDFNILFNKYQNMFIDFENHYFVESITITFMEWNSDNGDVTDNDSFEINNIYRLFYGEALSNYPIFKYTYVKDGISRYDADEASYIVSWNSVANEFKNQIVYANYQEVITSISSSDGNIIVEGEFASGTSIKINKVGDYYSIEFINDNEVIEVNSYIVKYKIDTNLDYKLYFVNDSVEEKNYKVYGEYAAFECNNTYFYFVENTYHLPVWAISTISVASTVVAILLVSGIVFVVKKKKNNKEEKTNN